MGYGKTPEEEGYVLKEGKYCIEKTEEYKALEEQIKDYYKMGCRLSIEELAETAIEAGLDVPRIQVLIALYMSLEKAAENGEFNKEEKSEEVVQPEA